MSIAVSLATQEFIAPHFIPELGEEGLTAHEIARALGVPVEHVHQRLKRSFLADIEEVQEWRYITNVMTVSSGTYAEREITSYALNTRAAKAFVATYRSKSGRGYLNFLFNCEDVVLNKLPEIERQLETMRTQLTMRAPKRERRIQVLSTLPTLPGFAEVPFHKLVPRSQANETERVVAKLAHTNKVMAGLEKRKENLSKVIGLTL